MKMNIVNFNDILGDVFVKYHRNIINAKFGLNQFNRHIYELKIADIDVPYDAIEYIKGIYDSGYGLKIISRTLGISYSTLRSAFNQCNIEIRKGLNVCTDKTREFRSIKAKDKNPLMNCTELHPEWASKSRTGIGGKYRKLDGSYVWLRSSWEYAYAKWLDDRLIWWSFEKEQYKLSDGTSYRPDFFIHDDNGNIIKIVEIKGYWDNRAYKADLLRKEYSIDVIMIDDITQYITGSYRKLLLEWKEYIKEFNLNENKKY